MSFANASFKLSVFEFDAAVDASSLPSFAENALPPVETLNVEPISGWVSPRHLLDNEIVPGTCREGKFFHLNVSKAERKIPKSLLTAYCRREEIEVMKEKGLSSLSRAERADIREKMKRLMLPKMPPALSGTDVAVDLARGRVFADSSSGSRLELLQLLFAKSAHSALIPLDPANAAVRLFDIQTAGLEPAVFSPKPNGDFVVNGIGYDFLTWLLWCNETGRTDFEPGESLPAFSIGLDGPVSLRLEAQGAHRVSLHEGAPLHGVECQAALLSGKKISSLKLLLKAGDDAWSAVVEGGSFDFSGVKPPALDV